MRHKERTLTDRSNLVKRYTREMTSGEWSKNSKNTDSEIVNLIGYGINVSMYRWTVYIESVIKIDITV